MTQPRGLAIPRPYCLSLSASHPQASHLRILFTTGWGCKEKKQKETKSREMQGSEQEVQIERLRRLGRERRVGRKGSAVSYSPMSTLPPPSPKPRVSPNVNDSNVKPWRDIVGGVGRGRLLWAEGQTSDFILYCSIQWHLSTEVFLKKKLGMESGVPFKSS